MSCFLIKALVFISFVQCPTLFLSENGASVEDVSFEHVESCWVTEFNCEVK